MDQNWIETARTGTFADSRGRHQTFTARDLDAIASAYDPSKADAPLVFGHPESEADPAFGRVKKLKSEGGKLLALLTDVPQKVQELVTQGHYRHVSMSLLPDRVTLRHVALLGAAQPAIDGLKAVSFAADEGSITVDFAADSGEGDTMTVEELQRQVGQLQARLDALCAENAELKKKTDSQKQDIDNAEAARDEAEKNAEKTAADFAAYKGQVEGDRREARVAELVKAGKVKPAEKAGVLEFAARLAAQTGTVNFAAPDGRTESLSMEERYFRDLEARPADERGYEFSAPPAHTGWQAGNINPAELTAKL